MNNQKLEPTNYQKDRLISFTKKYINQKLNDLHEELQCPNEFIFDFIKDIQKDWDPNTYKFKSEKLAKNLT